MAYSFFSRKHDGSKDPKRFLDPLRDFFEAEAFWNAPGAPPYNPNPFHPIDPPRFPNSTSPAPAPQPHGSSYDISTSPFSRLNPPSHQRYSHLDDAPTAPELSPLSKAMLKQQRRNYLLGHAVKSGLQSAFGEIPEPLDTQWLLAHYPQNNAPRRMSPASNTLRSPREPLPPEPFSHPSPQGQGQTFHGTLHYQGGSTVNPPRHSQQSHQTTAPIIHSTPQYGTLHYQRKYYKPEPTPPQSPPPQEKKAPNPKGPQPNPSQPLTWQDIHYPATRHPSAPPSHPTTPLPPHGYQTTPEATQSPFNMMILNGLKSVVLYRSELGERAIGAKSHFPAKTLTHENPTDLAQKLWSHFVHGQGQPVTINMAHVNLSQNLNLHKAMSIHARRLLLTHPLTVPHYKSTLEVLLGKKIKTHYLTLHPQEHVIVLEDEYVEVSPQLDPLKDPLRNPIYDLSLFAAFGRAKFNLKHTVLTINYHTQTVRVRGEIIPVHKDTKIEIYNFDPDPTRGEPWNTIVNYVHEYAPPGSTSFVLNGKNSSPFDRTYTFNDFLMAPDE